jgi:hypothetical protein
MHLQDGSGSGSDCRLIVGEGSPIRGTNFNQLRSALAEYLGYAKPSAYLDGLSSGDDDLSSSGESGKRKQESRGVVDNNHGGLTLEE